MKAELWGFDSARVDLSAPENEFDVTLVVSTPTIEKELWYIHNDALYILLGPYERQQ